MNPGPQLTTLFPNTTLFRSPSYPWWRPARPGSSDDWQAGTKMTLERSSRTAPGMIGPVRHFGKTGRQVRSRSEEHTSELQSRFDLVCRLLLEKKKSSSKEIS